MNTTNDRLIEELNIDRIRVKVKKFYGYDPEDLPEFISVVSAISSILGQEIENITMDQLLAEWELTPKTFIALNYKNKGLYLINQPEISNNVWYAITGLAQIYSLQIHQTSVSF